MDLADEANKLQAQMDMLLAAVEKFMKHNDIISMAVEEEYTDEGSQQVDDALNDCGLAIAFCHKAKQKLIE